MGQDLNLTRKVVGYTSHRVHRHADASGHHELSSSVTSLFLMQLTAAHWFAGQQVLGIILSPQGWDYRCLSHCVYWGSDSSPQQQTPDDLSCLSGPCFYFLMSANQCAFTLSLSHTDMNKMIMVSVYGIKWDSKMCVNHRSSHTSPRTAWSEVHPTTQLSEEALIASQKRNNFSCFSIVLILQDSSQNAWI